MMRQAPAFTGQAERMAQEIIRLNEALTSLRGKCPAFDEDMPTSKVVSVMESAVSIAQASLGQLEKWRSAMAVRQSRVREQIGDKSADFWINTGAGQQLSLL